MNATCLQDNAYVKYSPIPGMFPAESVPVDDPAAEMYVVGVLQAAGSWLDLPDEVRAQAAAAARPGVPIGMRAEALWRAVATGLDTLPVGEVRRLADAGLLAQELEHR